MDKIFVLDFGAQYSQLIARRIRELGVYSELIPYNAPLTKLKEAKGLIYSGGPASVYAMDAPHANKKNFALDIPILGICYGLQLIAHQLGGKVEKADRREYGPARIRIGKQHLLFHRFPRDIDVWMSHGDHITKMPAGFEPIASTKSAPYAAIAHVKKPIYGVQFHPEVTHTPLGKEILSNFVFEVCHCKPQWILKNFVDDQVRLIRERVKGKRAIAAISGGVDSSVSTALAHRAVGDQLTAIFVDTGMLREGEVSQVLESLGRHLKIPITLVNASGSFLKKLKGVNEPEKKRKIIGHEFIKTFEATAKKITPQPAFLVQGTLYPDVIESAHGMSGATARIIKSHHNVGGLPKKMGFQLIEPLRELFKDEVRKVGTLLGLSDDLIWRQPFPGPGLAVRIIGEITPDRLTMLRRADAIMREEIMASKFHRDLWQYFAVLPATVKSVGVMGDERSYAHPIILRAVTSSDVMTVDWARLPHELLAKISNRITNEVPGVNRVLYDITPKPPGTVEWE